MKITIVDGAPGHGFDPFHGKLVQITSALALGGHDVKNFRLSRMHLRPCTGCWGCWARTPGECVIPDETIQIRQAAIVSDRLIFASPLIMGFTSALLKKVQDKMIPLLLPYIELVNHECHHRKRYPAYPELGLLYQAEHDTGEEDLKIVREIYLRYALNFRTEFLFMETLDKESEELAYVVISH
ncbi:MAG: flavodoxin family protein [Bacteroidales bacterium]|nr:flavodoxin family protein [Bacteroidales bacterium]